MRSSLMSSSSVHRWTQLLLVFLVGFVAASVGFVIWMTSLM